MTEEINQKDIEGRKHGPWGTNNMYKEEWHHGTLHGIQEYYWPDGTLRGRGRYLYGEQHGLWEHYYENGTLRWREQYLYGKIHRLSENYYPDGASFKKTYYLAIK